MIKPRASLFVPAILFATLAVSAAGTLNAVGDSTVKFEAIGPAGLKINGSSSGLKTSESDGKVTITAPTGSFHTGIGLRDRHLRDHIEVDKHPDAKLVVDRSKFTLPSAGKADGTVIGMLTFHGVTRPTKVSYHITKGASDYHVVGDLDLNIIDHQVKKPCYLGVCVGDVVKVTAEFNVTGN